MSEENENIEDLIPKKSTDEFWDAFNDARMNKNVVEYCEMPIDVLKDKCHGMKCFLARIKATMIHNVDCRDYNWNVDGKPSFFSNLSSFYERLREHIEKMEESIRIKEERANERAEEYKERKRGEKVQGWWDETLIEMKKKSLVDDDILEVQEINADDDL